MSELDTTDDDLYDEPIGEYVDIDDIIPDHQPRTEREKQLAGMANLWSEVFALANAELKDARAAIDTIRHEHHPVSEYCGYLTDYCTCGTRSCTTLKAVADYDQMHNVDEEEDVE